jgi:alkaline phosphatase
MWALFANNDMDFELDRNPDQEPSLQEMTQIALEKLSKNENGFFLMVEGSKVDWAAHANDPAAMITDFLAFDKACQTAIEFAQKNQNTAVIIVPDHGNSGFSIGVSHCKSYSSATKNELFYNVAQVKLSASGIAKKLNEQHSDSVQSIFENYAGFQLDEQEINAIYHCKEYRYSPIPEAERSDIQITPALYSNSLSGVVAKLITSKTCFGFTTNGHTGEDVFLAAYHPHGTIPTGMVTNVALNHYMTAALGLHGQLEKLTETLFVPHYEVFKNYQFEIINDANDNNIPPTLVVKNKKKQLNIKPNTNIVTAGKKNNEIIQLNSVIVYVDVNNTFYLPQSLVNYLEK